MATEIHFVSTPTGTDKAVVVAVDPGTTRLSSSTLALVFNDTLTKDELARHLDAIELKLGSAFFFTGAQADLDALVFGFIDGGTFADGAGFADQIKTLAQIGTL